MAACRHERQDSTSLQLLFVGCHLQVCKSKVGQKCDDDSTCDGKTKLCNDNFLPEGTVRL